VFKTALPFATSVNRSIDYIGTVRGRIGFLFTPALLLYGTGGLAYGQTNLNLSLVGPAPFALGDHFRDTRSGWTAGGGLEAALSERWSAKAEYLYHDLGYYDLAMPELMVNRMSGAAFANMATSFRAHADGQLVRASLNYHFDWAAPAPIVAKY